MENKETGKGRKIRREEEKEGERESSWKQFLLQLKICRDLYTRANKQERASVTLLDTLTRIAHLHIIVVRTANTRERVVCV